MSTNAKFASAPQGVVYIVSAPSGAGKSSLTKALVKELPNLEFSISHTTRPKRAYESDGKHYWFIDKEEFTQKVHADEMLEWATVHGNCYGTSQNEIERILQTGRHPLLEIDVKGYEKLLANQHLHPRCIAIFILPPDLETLWQRLEARGTDSLAIRKGRFQTARYELEAGQNYPHFLINDNFDRAYAELRDFVALQKPLSLSHAAGQKHCQQLVEAFKNTQWIQDLLPTEAPNAMQEAEK